MRQKDNEEIKLAAGEEITDLILVLSKGGTLWGIVVDADDQAVANISVRAEVRQPLRENISLNSYGSSANTDSEGRFEVAGLTLGEEYRAIVYQSGFGGMNSDRVNTR